MLSRIAANLYWIGRYLERSGGTARILDVHLQLLLEDPWVEEDTACRSLLSVMGAVGAEEGPLAREDVLRILGVDRTQYPSIAFSLAAARENARRAREIVSTELWECLNTTTNRMPRRVTSDQSHRFFSWVHERTALAVGIVETSASRDEAWDFFTLGRSLESADMTARLLATRSLTEASGPSWTTILRSCGAYESYLRTYRGVPSTRNAAEFLVLDRLFPRSILFSISRVEQCLRSLAPTSTDRGGSPESAVRLAGRIRSELEYRPRSSLLDDLPAAMTAIQDATRATNDAIRDTYFPELVAQSWSGDNT